MLRRWNAWVALVFFLPVGASSVRADLLSGFDAYLAMPGSVGSATPVSIGFTVNFFGTLHSHLYVNTNGNVTFGAPLDSNTPFNLTTTNWQIIAPFFTDMGTRPANAIRYGPGTVDGRPAFGVVWPAMGAEATHVEPSNAFGLVLVNRSDSGQGHFDVELRYHRLQWDSGQGGAGARVGFSGGTGVAGTYFEMPGSGIPGAFLDGAPNSLVRGSLNSNTPGRFLFQMREICYLPEPGSLALAGVGAAGMLAWAWRLRRRSVI